MDSMTDLLYADKNRWEALKALRSLNLENGYIAAGFLRNLVWDHLHNKKTPTPLNDVDVIYFCLQKNNPAFDIDIEKRLKNNYPGVNWQVRNQAIMHKRNGDSPYKNIEHAMSYWPEKETAVAVRLTPDDQLEFTSAFSLDILYALTISYNPARSQALFRQRIAAKQWLSIWPKLNVVLP